MAPVRVRAEDAEDLNQRKSLHCNVMRPFAPNPCAPSLRCHVPFRLGFPRVPLSNRQSLLANRAAPERPDDSAVREPFGTRAGADRLLAEVGRRRALRTLALGSLRALRR